MSESRILCCKVDFGGDGCGSLASSVMRSMNDETSNGKTLRVSRLMALAIRMQQLVEDGVTYAELARLVGVSRARLTQIMNLTLLAPDIQEALLFLPTKRSGRDGITERQLRPIAAEPDWAKQRKRWTESWAAAQAKCGVSGGTSCSPKAQTA